MAFRSASPARHQRVIIQVPGGMISNLAYIEGAGAIEGWMPCSKKFHTCAKTSATPLVTPPRVVGTQAALKVLPPRYKSVTNEVKLYLQGRYGKAPGINEDVAKYHRQPRRHHLRAADLMADDATCYAANRGAGQVGEDVLTYAIFLKSARLAAGTRGGHPQARRLPAWVRASRTARRVMQPTNS